MKIVPEPDRLDARVPLGILGVSILTLLLSGVLTVVVRDSVPGSQAAAAPLPIVGTGVVSGRVEQAEVEGGRSRPLAAPEQPGAPAAGLFARHASPVLTREPTEQLDGYGWVDRERRLVHIPIERAKQLYLSRLHASSKAGATLPVSQPVERHGP